MKGAVIGEFIAFGRFKYGFIPAISKYTFKLIIKLSKEKIKDRVTSNNIIFSSII